MEQSQGPNYTQYLGFRKVEVWIGKPGSSPNNADYNPPPPNEI